MKVKDILDLARNDLQDATKVRWSDNDLLAAFNLGRREIVRIVPSSNPVTSTLVLVAGTRQTITGSALLNVIRNMGIDGLTPGKTVLFVPQDVLDTTRPDWHSITADATVKYFTTVKDDLKTFLVYPPQPIANQGHLSIIQSVPPIDTLIANIATEDLGIDDKYGAALVSYVLFKAFSPDSEAGNFDRASGHLTIFENSIGVK